MSLRSRLFLVFGGLVALLVGAQWWLVRTLAQDLQGESGEMALSLSSSVLAVLGAEHSEASGVTGQWTKDVQREERVRAYVMRQELDERSDVEVPTFGSFARRMRFGPDTEGTIELILGVGDGNLSIERTALPDVMLRQGELDESWGLNISNHKAPTPPYAPHEPPHELMELALEGSVSNALALGLDPLNCLSAATFAFCPTPPRFETFLFESGLHEVPAPEFPPSGATRVDKIPIPSQGMDTALESFSSRLLAGSGAILLLGLLVAGLFAHRVSSPLRDLARAANELGDGQLGRTVPERGDPEVSRTIGAFNAMSVRLADLDAEARSLRERRHLSELGEIARGFAHTLRNPLNVLGLTLDELARNAASPEAADLHATGRAQIRRVDQAVRGFLALASSDVGRLEDVRLYETAQDVALELLQSGVGDVDVHVEGARDLELRGIGAELRSVLHSLVVNAVEASPAGTRVEVRVESTPEGACLVIEDQGDGLPDSVRERLFTPHITTKEHGAGMGLYLAWRIATGRYHGSLELQDRDEGGTRAVLCLTPRQEDDRAA